MLVFSTGKPRKTSQKRRENSNPRILRDTVNQCMLDLLGARAASVLVLFLKVNFQNDICFLFLRFCLFVCWGGGSIISETVLVPEMSRELILRSI